MNNAICFPFFWHLILSSKKKLSQNTRNKTEKLWRQGNVSSGKHLEAKRPDADWHSQPQICLYPCLSSCPPCLLLPLLAEPGRRIYSLVLRCPLHHGHILLLGFFLGEDQFCFTMHVISLVFRQKQGLPFIETLSRQKHAIWSSLHHFGAISPPQIVLWFWRGGQKMSAVWRTRQIPSDTYFEFSYLYTGIFNRAM